MFQKILILHKKVVTPFPDSVSNRNVHKIWNKFVYDVLRWNQLPTTSSKFSGLQLWKPSLPSCETYGDSDHKISQNNCSGFQCSHKF